MNDEKKTAANAKREERIAVIMEATGWDHKHAAEMMAKSKELGVKNSQYVKYKLWEQPLEKHVEIVEEALRVIAEKRAAAIETVVTETGWDEERAVTEMQALKDEYKISFPIFASYRLWEYPEDERYDEYLKIKERRQRVKLFKKQCVELAMKEKGWTEEEALAHIEATKERTGIGYMDYRRYYFFSIPDDQQVERYQEILASRENRKNRDTNKRERFYDVIANETGWSRKEIVANINDAKQRTGATYKDYYAFRFWEISEEEQAKYFTQKMSNAISTKYDVNDFHRDILLNKELSCYHFSDFFRRGWCINRTTTKEEFREIFKNDKKVVYKPLDGNGGIGIKIFEVNEENIDAVYEEIAALQRGVVEAYVVQHKDMSSLAPSSVNTIRVVSISTSESAEVAYVSVRIGSGKSVVDNFTDGGMVAGVDIKTGTIVTPGVTVDGVVNEYHPETGTVFRGFKIPFFKEALELVEEAGRTITGYIGWDVAITENGPVLIEANIMPGNRILQMPYVCDRIGKRDVMAKYL